MIENSWFAINVHFVIWPVLLATLAAGLFATIHPKAFSTFAERSSTWVDTSDWFKKLEQPINLDQLVYRHSRIFGVLVTLTTIGLAGWFWQLT